MSQTTVRQIAIIGSTASGKSQLAIDISKKFNSIILSLDSLSVYKDIDIASAKPTLEERDNIPHYGIDILYPNVPFDVTLFINLYKNVYKEALDNGKNLIIVGGTSFYLKSLIDGISPLPKVSTPIKEDIHNRMRDIKSVYKELHHLDSNYMDNISSLDSYRVEKALTIYLATNTPPSIYFKNNPPKPTIIGELPIYSILTQRDILRKRIEMRTKNMIDMGLIDEVAYLEKRYNRSPNSMKSIGIRETLDYFDGKLDFNMLKEKIVINTARLAKRQNTFNKSQFKNIVALELDGLEKRILEDIEVE
jgi:tRNA dimethylallyltransferase